MTTVEKQRGLKQRIAEAFIGWIYQEILKVEKGQEEWSHALEEAKKPQDEWNRMVPCVHCKREIPEFEAYCQHCKRFQDESRKEDTQPLYWIKIRRELHPFQLETGRPLIDGKRPFVAYLEAVHKDEHKDDEKWLL